jgi:hypothetical protein
MNNDEKVIGSFHSGISLDNDYFKFDNLNHDWILLPLFAELKEQCDGLIKESGVYSFNLIVKKIE